MVVGLKPREAFAPFFLLNLEEWRKEEHPGEPAGVSNACSGSGSDGGRNFVRPAR
jgi:hypothetical protein